MNRFKRQRPLEAGLSSIGIVVALIMVVLIVIGVAMIYRGTRKPEAPPAVPIGEVITIEAPLGLPPVPVPKGNPPTMETIALGKRLYFDKALSADDTIACASCHHPDFAFTDGQAVSTGIGGQKGGRNAPTVLNSAYYELQFWDGRSPSLEDQARGPVQNPIEMGHTLEGVEEKLSRDASYVGMFEEAYGPGAITYEKVEKAIASFERTVIAGGSPFDQWLYAGVSDAMPFVAERGFEVFTKAEKGNCAVCHTVGGRHALFADNQFHNIGVGANLDGTFEDIGRYDVTKVESDRGAFKTPTLRNIAQTAPYMHDGSLKTLKEVIDFYIGGGNSNNHLDAEIHALGHLTGQERSDLLAFLESLTGDVPTSVAAPAENDVDVGEN